MSRWRELSRYLFVPVVAAFPFDSYAEVTFAGLDEDLEKNARALMALAAAPCDAPEWRIERLYRDADSQLQNALEALGHYRYEMEKSLSLDAAECWQAEFIVSPGEPVRIRNVALTLEGEAADDAGLDTHPELLPETGEVLNHGVYEAYKRSLVSDLTARGYFDVQLTGSRVTVEENLQHADIELHVDSGPRYHFGEVRFSESILRAELLAGYVQFEKGDPWDAREIANLHEQLSGSGFFAAVSIQSEPLAEGDLEVPVLVSISPGKRRVFSAGAGYATDNGIQARLGYTNRRRNDKGHQLDIRLFLSTVDSELTGNYRWPRGRPDAEWLDLYGGFLRKRTDTSESDKSTLGFRAARNRTENWLESPYLEVTHEEYLVGDQFDTSKLLIPGIRWETTVGRNLRRLSRGHRMSLDIHGAHESVFSDTTFGQLTASAKWITTVGRFTRLLARADLGGTASKALDDLPATARFFAGGDTSVRGYDFETIGPVDDEGNVIGGAHQVVLSLEADWAVRQDWAVAAFVDSGSAFNDGDIDMRTGVGLGIRWYSPVGPIRLDFAHPLDDPDSDFRLHLTLGPDL